MVDKAKFNTVQIQKIKTQIQEGKDSGKGIPSDKVFNRLEAKYRYLVKKIK